MGTTGTQTTARLYSKVMSYTTLHFGTVQGTWRLHRYKNYMNVDMCNNVTLTMIRLGFLTMISSMRHMITTIWSDCPSEDYSDTY